MRDALGPIPKEKLLEAANAPYGKAADIIRKYDPLFGKRGKDGDQKTFKVSLTRRVIQHEEAEVMVLAGSEDEAEEMVKAMDSSDFTWDECDWETERPEIEHIEDLEGNKQ